MRPFPSLTAPPPPKRSQKPWLALFVGLVVLAYVVYCLLRPLGVVAPSVGRLPQVAGSPVSLPWPAAGQAAVGAPGYGVLASQNDTSAVPIASITKIITALCVLDKHPLKAGEAGPTITLSQSDIEIYNNYVAQDGSVLPIQSGEQLTEYQMLQAMLLPSANNIADSLAIWSFGSLGAYKDYAAQYLNDNGMVHTQLGADASGLDPGTISTAGDLVRLGELALKQPAIMAIAGQPRATLPIAGTVYNYNGLLGEAGITGLKTGNNDQDLGAFLFTASVTVGGAPLQLVGVVLDQSSLYNALTASLPLVQALQAGFVRSAPIAEGQIIATYTAPWGATAHAVAAKTTPVTHWQASPLTSSAEVKNITVATPDNAKVGSLTLKNGSATTPVPVVLDKPLAKPSIWWRLLHP